ncbi:hypothetical protein IV203_025676 [Nitzschia inconspicua]|uniref:Uncharacterized protein n=1 Tax=Nitzschia inconspicua TaxID=303405 RepID=A0A9K3LHJ5_9STRA|nr:hypothetical protein IV203_025676 [Nitzschia inconspicua]
MLHEKTEITESADVVLKTNPKSSESDERTLDDDTEISSNGSDDSSSANRCTDADDDYHHYPEIRAVDVIKFFFLALFLLAIACGTLYTVAIIHNYNKTGSATLPEQIVGQRSKNLRSLPPTTFAGPGF